MTRSESRSEWVARKKAKPFWGQPRFKQTVDGLKLKPGIRRRASGFYEIKGQCPCAVCGHELSWDCDPGGGMVGTDYGCLCCDEVCS